jgi:hypothetical protein
VILAAQRVAIRACGLALRQSGTAGSQLSDTTRVSTEPDRLRFSAPDIELLREVLAKAPQDIIQIGERMARGEVVERPEADAVVEVLSEAFAAEDQGIRGEPTLRGRRIDDLIGIAQQMSRDFYD